MSGNTPCPPDCTCAKHTNSGSYPHKKCPPGCECGKHKRHVRKPHSAEAKAKMAEKRIEAWKSPTYRSQQSAQRRGKRKDGSPAVGYTIHRKGHVMLTMQHGHPLANTDGCVFEHRKLLYDDIGPGPHSCHWHPLSGCGNLALEWPEISVDHLDDDPTNNDLANLVVSCMGCNWGRSKASWFRDRL